MSDDAELKRLRSRLERERRARREAETIAERGMRELWDVNHQLEETVSLRVRDAERREAATRLLHEVQLGQLAQLVDELLTAARAPESVAALQMWASAARQGSRHAPSEVTDAADPLDIADAIVDRWQRPAAQRGVLLDATADRADRPVVGRWAVVLCAADLLVGTMLAESSGGACSIAVRSSDDWVCAVVAMDGQAVSACSGTTFGLLRGALDELVGEHSLRVVDGATCLEVAVPLRS